MNYFYLISCLIGLSSCGSEVVPNRSPKLEGDEILVSYVIKFISDANSLGYDVPVTKDLILSFDETSSKDAPKRVAYCYRGIQNFIVVDLVWFDEASESDKEALMYHELGHCLLNREHSHDCLDWKNTYCAEPYSLMYPQIIEGVYELNKERYLKELFGRISHGTISRN